MSFECEFCKKLFKTKSILKTHQNTAKFCLNLRQKEPKEFKCEFCMKNFTTKHNLLLHNQICLKKIDHTYQSLLQEERDKITLIYEERLKEKDLLINKLQDQIKDLAQRGLEKETNVYQNSTNSHNKIIDNRVLNMIPLNLTQDRLIQTLEEKFTENHLMQGQKGVAEFMLENILVMEGNDGEDKKYLMKCTDPSRKVFITVDEEGNIVKDVNAQKLTKIISEPVKEKCHQLFKQIHNRFFTFYQNIGNELEDDDEEKKSLDIENDRFEYATNKVVEIGKLKNDNTEFVKNLIPTLTN